MIILIVSNGEVMAVPHPVSTAPSFYLTDLNGADFFASKVYGSKAKQPSIVVLGFFATWCIPCRSEAPQLEILAKAFPKTRAASLSDVFSFSERNALLLVVTKTNVFDSSSLTI